MVTLSSMLSPTASPLTPALLRDEGDPGAKEVAARATATNSRSWWLTVQRSPATLRAAEQTGQVLGAGVRRADDPDDLAAVHLEGDILHAAAADTRRRRPGSEKDGCGGVALDQVLEVVLPAQDEAGQISLGEPRQSPRPLSMMRAVAQHGHPITECQGPRAGCD